MNLLAFEVEFPINQSALLRGLHLHVLLLLLVLGQCSRTGVNFLRTVYFVFIVVVLTASTVCEC